MKQVFEKMLRLIIPDFSSKDVAKAWGENILKQQKVSHLLGVGFFLCAAALFFLDITVNDASYSFFLVDLFNFDPKFKQHIENGELLIIHIAAALINVIIAFFCAIYFFCKYGFRQKRSEFYGFSFLPNILGNLVPFFVTIILLILFSLVFWLGGVLIGIAVPERLQMNVVPGFTIIQILFLARVHGHITSFMCGVFLMIMPFELHPFRQNGFVKNAK